MTKVCPRCKAEVEEDEYEFHMLEHVVTTAGQQNAGLAANVNLLTLAVIGESRHVGPDEAAAIYEEYSAAYNRLVSRLREREWKVPE